MSDGSREQFSAVAGGSTEPTRGSVSAATVLKHNPALLSDEVLERTFAARGPLLADLVERVRQNSGRDSAQHYLLIGPRGSGKTTLLRLLAIRIRQDADLSRQWLPVLFAEEEPSIYDVEDFLLTILERMAPAVPEAGRVRSEVMAFSLEDRQHGADLALVALEEVAKEAGRRLLLLVDNLDQILGRTTAGDELATRRLRSTFQHSPILMLVGSSTAIFEELIDYRRPLYQFFAPIHLAPLTYAQVLELLRRRAAVDGNNLFLRPTRELRIKVRVVTEITGGNPRLVVALYDLLSGSPMLDDMDALMRLLDELTPYYKARLEALPAQQRKLLDLIVRAGGAASPAELAQASGLRPNLVASQLRRLREANWLRLRRGSDRRSVRYAIADQLLRYWYQMRYLADQRHRFAFLISFYRDLYGAEELESLQAGLLDRLEWAVAQRGRASVTDYTVMLREASSRLIAIDYALPATRPRDGARWRHARLVIEAGDTQQALAVLEGSRGEHVSAGDKAAEGLDERAIGSVHAEMGDYATAVPHLARAELLFRQLMGHDAEAYRPSLAGTLNNLGIALGEIGRLEEAERTHREAEQAYRRLAEQQPERFLPDLAGTLNNLGIALGGLGRLEDAERAHREAEQIYRRLAEQQPERFLADLAMALNNLGDVLRQMGRLEEGERLLREAEPVYRRLAEQQPERFLPYLAGTLNNLGITLRRLGRLEEAERAHREEEQVYRRLSEQQPERFLADLAMALNNLGVALRDFGEAERLFREAEQVYRRLSEQQPERFLADLAMALNNLGGAACEMGRLEEAEEALREARAIRHRLAEQRPERFLPDLADTLHNLGVALGDMERLEEAEEALREAEAIRRHLAEQQPWRQAPYLQTLRNLWRTLHAQGRLDGAEAVLRQAAELAERLPTEIQQSFRTDLTRCLAATLAELQGPDSETWLTVGTDTFLDVMVPLQPDDRRTLWLRYLLIVLRAGVSHPAFEAVLSRMAERLPESHEVLPIFRLAHRVRSGSDPGALASVDEDTRRLVEVLLKDEEQSNTPAEDAEPSENRPT